MSHFQKQSSFLNINLRQFSNQQTQYLERMEDPIPAADRVFNLVNGHNSELQKTKILIVGVGGIGCEILKVLSKMPIQEVHVIDMDTIELSNLNRQFLFKKEHRGLSKALTAKESILKLNPQLNIQSHHKNIRELPIPFIKQFSFLIMALDNIEARNYVNKIGVRLGIPIVDAGTLGYKGNVATIIPRVSRCYSCEPKDSRQKEFPVCTIRQRPEKPIHCVVWGKLLFQVVFGPENDDNDLKDLAELAKTKGILEIMTQLFDTDVLSIKNAKQGSESKLSEIFAKNIQIIPREQVLSHYLEKILEGENFSKHEQKLELNEHISIFSESFERLMQQRDKQGIVPFQKDDDNIIHFISSGANLRMHCFNIGQLSFNEVKNMAGNIVPAIASTNSIVSGIEVSEMIKYLKGDHSKLKHYFVQNQSSKVMALKQEKAFGTCLVCNPAVSPVTIEANLTKFSLRDLVQIVKEKTPDLEQFSVNHGSKEFYNSEQPVESLLEKSIFDLCQSFEVDLIVTNEETMKKVCVVWLVHNAEAETLSISNQEMFRHQPITEQSPACPEETKPAENNEDSDVVIFNDEQQSPQLEIVEAKTLTEKKGEIIQEEAQVATVSETDQKELEKRTPAECNEAKENGDEIKKKVKLSD